MFLSSSDLKVQVEDVLGRYFEKMYNLLSNGENLDEIANNWPSIHQVTDLF